MTGIIYKATNLINGKVYIGQTCRKLNKRRNDHYNATKRGSLFRFHLALKKYKREDIEWKVLESNIDLNNIDEIEINYIKLYDSMNFKNGYNMNIGGNILSDEIKQKISVAKTGQLHTIETKEKISNTLVDYYSDRPGTNYGKTMSDSSKKLISDSAKERYSNGMIHPMYGKHHSDVSKKKMSESSNNKGDNNPMFGRTGH